MYVADPPPDTVVHLYTGASCEGPAIACKIWECKDQGPHPACHSVAAFLHNIAHIKGQFNYCEDCQATVPQNRQELALLETVRL